jgi:hypothetical protein
VHHHRKQLIQAVRIRCVVHRIEQPQLQGERHPILQLQISSTFFLVFEPFEMEGEDVGEGLDLHPLLGLVQAAAGVAEELVRTREHFGGGEGAEAGGDRAVLVDVDGEVEEGFVSGGDL